MVGTCPKTFTLARNIISSTPSISLPSGFACTGTNDMVSKGLSSVDVSLYVCPSLGSGVLIRVCCHVESVVLMIAFIHCV